VRDASGYNPLVNEEDLSEGERLRIADELRRIREGVRDRALIEPGRREVLPPPPVVRTPEAPRQESGSASSPPPSRPDNAGVNASWRIRSASAGGGLGGRLARAVLALLDPTLEAQEAFNSKQVQLDNDLLSYVDARLDATHRHYDEVLGIHGRHMGEIDERHMIVQEELVAHVHDLVRRIDLVLSEAERGRLSLEFALKDLRTRVERIEQRLRAAAEGRTERE
jgi:hypothetical protein